MRIYCKDRCLWTTWPLLRIVITQIAGYTTNKPPNTENQMRSTTKLFIVAALAFLSGPQQARTQIMLDIANASFEDPVLSSGQYTNVVIGWTGSFLGTQNVADQGWFSSLPAGNNVAILDYNLTIAQTLTNNLSEGDYTLSAYVGQSQFINFPRTFALQLIAGSTLLAETTALAPVGSLNLFTVNYSAAFDDLNLGQALTVRLAASIEGADYSTYNSTALDGVSLGYTAVPEPSVAALALATGGLWAGVVGFRSLRRGRTGGRS